MNFDETINRQQTGSLKWNKYAGSDILPFWVADMDFKSPAAVLRALHERVDHGVFGYTLAEKSCVETVCNYLRDRHDWVVKPEWILWTPGLVPAINLACRAFAEPGDGIMTFTPVYYPFLSAPDYANQELQAVPLVLDEVNKVWEIDFDRLENTVTDRSKVFILSNPHNPVGKVFSKSEMEKLGAFIVRHDLVLCSDEIHCDLILNSKKHICAGTLGTEVQDHLIVMLSPSKTYNLAGMSCAYLVIPSVKLRSRFKQEIRGIITEVNSLGYTACEAAYRYGESWRQELLAYLEENRKLIYETVDQQLEGVSVYPMDATYLAWLDVRKLDLESPAQYFEKFGIGLSEGAGFQGPGFVRLNFGCPKSMLREGLFRFQKGLEAL